MGFPAQIGHDIILHSALSSKFSPDIELRIAKPLLLISTPIGVIWGLFVAYRMKPWLAWLMLCLVTVISIFIGYTVAVIRREQRDQIQREAQGSLDTHR